MKSKIMVLWFALMVTEMLLLGCSKKSEARENPETGSVKTEVYNSESDFETETSDDGKSITIKKYKGNATAVRIPEKINNLPVKRIGEYAFKKTEITSVTIPDSVAIIRSGAFEDCTNLKSVNLPNNLTLIFPTAFSDCSKLVNITIPDSTYKIGGYAFSGCKSLNSVTFASGSNIQDIDFSLDAFPEGKDGDGGNTLKTAYSTGKAGTYTRQKNGSTWKKK